MSFKTINPATLEVLEEQPFDKAATVGVRLDKAVQAFADWRRLDFNARGALLEKVADLLEAEVDSLAELMAREMGKPVAQGQAEVKKCAGVCRFYAEHTVNFLTPQQIKTEAQGSFVRYDPLGAVLGIMPWNFPLWQVFRWAAPTLMAGNVCVLKHAANVLGCAKAIVRLFTKAGFPEEVFQAIYIDGPDASNLIADDRIAGAAITGSVRAGSHVGAAAGKAIKPSILELGGSDAFIVLADANLAEAAKVGVQSRCLNGGQTCISAKRFIVEDAIYDDFVDLFIQEMRAVQLGDPLSETTAMGPMARLDLRDELAKQVEASVKDGASLVLGGQVSDQPGAWYPPTILGNVSNDNLAAREELFGPAAALMRAKDEADTVRIANNSQFGLGASLWSKDTDKAARLAAEIEAGAVFINSLVKSDQRVPFGGIKKSGYGRELGAEGPKAFCNVKTVWIA